MPSRSGAAAVLATATAVAVAALAGGCGGGDEDRPAPAKTSTGPRFSSVTALCDRVDAEPYLALEGGSGQVERLSFDAGGGPAGDPWSVCLVVRVDRLMLLPTDLAAPEAADDTEGQVLAVKLWVAPDAPAAGEAYARRLGDLPGADPAAAGSVAVAGFDTATKVTSVHDRGLDRVATHTVLAHTGNGLFEATFTETCLTCRGSLLAAREAWRPTVPADRAFPLLEATLRDVVAAARG